MPRITVELLRKRAEHNEGIVSTLEELSLHQEELEKIEVIGTLCRRLRILYLQNNIIEKIENLTHLKELRYLNLALNNIRKIEGLQSCEFLEKLDLTVNFIDFDTLEESINHLKRLPHLQELYLLGNPAQSKWEDGFRDYVIASLPSVSILDGKEITRGDRIKAMQVFSARQKHVRDEARKKIHEEQVVLVERNGAFDADAKAPYTPESRREMYMELAEQKEQQEARRKGNAPPERDLHKEHEEAMAKAQSGSDLRQCNQGKWPFRLWEEDAFVYLEVGLPRFLDSSLLDLDVHPEHVTIVAKNKVFRLRLPAEVLSDLGKAERSQTTGALKLTLPKLHPRAPSHGKVEQVAQGVRRQKLHSTTPKTTTDLQPVMTKHLQPQEDDEPPLAA